MRRSLLTVMVYSAANAAAVSAAAVMPARAADASLEDLRVICRMVHSLPEHRAYYTRHPGGPEFRPRGTQRTNIRNTEGTKGTTKGNTIRDTNDSQEDTEDTRVSVPKTCAEMDDPAAAF